MSRLVIGVGNPFRGDDAAGIEVVKRLRNVPTYEATLGGYELMDVWEWASEVIIVDAMHSDAAGGTIRRFTPLDEPLPAGTFASTHASGVAETIEMARELDRLPAGLTVVGIEAGSVDLGSEISPEVEEAICRVVEEIDHA